MTHASRMSEQERRDNIELVTRLANSVVPSGAKFIVVLADPVTGWVAHGGDMTDSQAVAFLRITADVIESNPMPV